MYNIFRFIIKHHYVLLFIVMEIIALIMYSNSENFNTTQIMSVNNRITSNYYNRISSIENYFTLNKSNDELQKENANLYNQIKSSYYTSDTSSFEVVDTLYKQQYIYIPAKVIKNTINKQNNFLILNKGSNHQIEKDMAVTSPNGIVGIVVSTSNNFCIVMSLLNANSRISAKLQNSIEIGTVTWDGRNYQVGKLSDIPFHAKVKPGDSIVTSGYSYSFPQGLPVGIVKDFETDDDSHFITANFKYSVDFNSIDYVYIIKNLMKEELEELEEIEKSF